MDEFSTSDFEDTEPGGSTVDQTSVIPPESINADFDAFNNPAGNVSNNYVQPNPYTMDASGKISGLTSLDSVKQFIADNKALMGLAGAAAGLMTPGAQYGKTGYQGSIPQLLATRKMVSAPPTRAQGYRPGAGGVNYGGDVSYTALPKDTAIWSQLSGNSGTAANANLTQADTTAAQDAGITKLVNNASAVKTTDLIPYFKLNPDVAAAYAKNSYGMTPEQFANYHWQNYGKNEQRVSPDGVTPEVLNSNIIKWINDNPSASAADITAVMKKSGVNAQDVAKALGTDNTMSAGKEWALTNNMGLDTLSKNILNAQAQGYTPEQQAEMLAKAGLNQSDLDAASKYAKDTGYQGVVEAAKPAHNMEDSIHALLAQQKAGSDLAANNATKLDTNVGSNAELDKSLATLGLGAELPVNKEEATNYFKPSYDNTDYSYMQFAEGGMARGRYLQGGTDGMADEIPAQIGDDQPAALSHGEFVIPADVVSHLGNGNSDAGAKKLYSMMDKIRMARTGNKKQGKRINPDKFMPGGLAAAYAAGGKVKKYETGGSVITNPGIAGVESSLSNWAGDYTTNMLGQGQALANMPYQQYMGPLTAGPSSLQNKLFTGLEKTTFPSNLGGTFSSSGAYAPPNMSDTVGSASTPSAGGTPITSAQPAAPSAPGIASQYMNPYLQSVLTPQLDELRRQSQINLQPALGKLTQAGGLGGGRQAIMESEANRNLLQEQNKTVGQGYANAYDKAMQQFNTEQGQAKGLADLYATQGAAQRGIESEGIAADKAAFEEARANPYKMVQFQQSLLQGLPLEAKSYTGIQQSDLVKAAQGATTVNQLLKSLGLIT